MTSYKLPKEMEAYIKENTDALVDLLVSLCKVPAPSLHEQQRAKFCKEYLESFGAKKVHIDEALNVLYPIGCTEHDEIVIFMAHMDTVFPDTTPMPVKIKDNKIYSPGVGDDTANLAILLLMAKYITLSNLKPNCGILFVANSGEEGLGNLKGCKQLIKDYGKRIREVISFDCTYNTLCQKAVGSSRYKITVRTEGGHSFQDFGNRNAIYYLSSLITKLYDIDIPKIGNSQTTYNVGVIEGGTSVNTIAQNASVLYEYRSDTHECLEIMKDNFTTIINNYINQGLDIEIEELGTRPCMQNTNLALQSALTKRCEALLTYYTGHKPQLVSASTDCNIPFSLGIPTVCFGLYQGAGAHTREEWVDISSLTTGFHLAAGLILQYFNSAS